MKQIQHKVNIVPIIGKADTLTESEMKRLKRRIMSDIQENNIQVNVICNCTINKTCKQGDHRW